MAVLLVYGQATHFDFISYDDPEYVSQNPYVSGGLTAGSIKWAFTEPTVGNWTPVTVVSHLADVQFFGMESGAHHLVNVLLHMMAAMLLYAGLYRASRLRWPSAFVAAIFALHPLHVESVAWVAERKDVLSACFGFAALYAYVRYVERPSTRAYLTVTVLFALGLMSKPMLVTFPFVLAAGGLLAAGARVVASADMGKAAAAGSLGCRLGSDVPGAGAGGAVRAAGLPAAGCARAPVGISAARCSGLRGWRCFILCTRSRGGRQSCPGYGWRALGAGSLL